MNQHHMKSVVAEQPALGKDPPTSQMASSRRLGRKLRLSGSFTFREAH